MVKSIFFCYNKLWVILMNCKEFEKLIPSFIHDNMKEELLPDFVDHVRHCKECEEELAIQYLTTEGLNRLEKGASFSLDKELTYKISKADRLVRLRNRIDIICRNVEIFSILILCLTLLFLFI